MKVCVLVKHVPDTAARIEVAGGNAIDGSVKFVMNPHDENALEEAVRIVEREGGEVVALTLGGAAAAETLRAALAVGADRGIHIRCDAPFPDVRLKACAFRAVLEQDGIPDLVLAGKQSVDTEGMQLPFWLGALLGMPVASEVTSLSLEGGTAIVERETGAGERLVLEMDLPCVVGAARGLNQPRYPRMMDVMKARKKPVREVPLERLGLDHVPAGPELVRLEAAPERGRARMLPGQAAEAAEELLRLLREEEKIL